jgi:predicted dehydrogenase
MRIATAEALGFSLPPHRPDYENRRTDYGIGLVGLHWIVQCAYLPAYRAARFNVVGAAEINPDRIAEAVEKGFPRDAIAGDWRELVRRDDVAIVDCCFGHRRDGLERRRQVIEAAGAARKHVLIQKPVAHTVAVAEEFARIAAQAGIRLAVNQNARYNPANYSIKQLLSAERLGRPRIVEVRQYWGSGAALPPAERVHATIDHMIHHADVIRWWVGQPCVSVYARSLHGTTLATYEFADGTVAHHVENHSGVRAHENEVRVMTERGTIKAAHNWGWHVPSSAGLDFVHVWTGGGKEGLALPLPEHIYEPPWHRINPWEKARGPYYDLGAPVAGFMGTMGALMRAAETGEPPENDVSTAIESMRMCIAAHHSSNTGRPVDPREIPADLAAEH